MNIFNKKFTILFLLGVFTLVSFAQEQQKEMSPEQKAWMEYMQPGEMHKMLEKDSGKWKTITKYWMYSGAEPQITKGEENSKMIMGGRYRQSMFTGTAMGMPFEGMSLEGFDNATQEFTSIWIDNLGTGTAVAKGKYNPENKTISYLGSMIDPISKKEIKFKEVVTLTNDSTRKMEMFMGEGEKEFKSMEIIFTR
jgi:hypothetical protein